jgi:hypothetical protein
LQSFVSRLKIKPTDIWEVKTYSQPNNL